MPAEVLLLMSQINELAERVERLLMRYEELQRTNALLQDQLASMTADRDSLRSRLGAARQRIDALLERLPENLHPDHTPTDGRP
jgi:cell division protein ZapB